MYRVFIYIHIYIYIKSSIIYHFQSNSKMGYPLFLCGLFITWIRHSHSLSLRPFIWTGIDLLSSVDGISSIYRGEV
jgi:hypothetical protein